MLEEEKPKWQCFREGLPTSIPYEEWQCFREGLPTSILYEEWHLGWWLQATASWDASGLFIFLSTQLPPHGPR